MPEDDGPVCGLHYASETVPDKVKKHGLDVKGGVDNGFIINV